MNTLVAMYVNRTTIPLPEFSIRYPKSALLRKIGSIGPVEYRKKAKLSVRAGARRVVARLLVNFSYSDLNLIEANFSVFERKAYQLLS